MCSFRVDSCAHETDAQETDADEMWGGYGQQDRYNHDSLLQNIVSFTRLFCKTDRLFYRSY